MGKYAYVTFLMLNDSYLPGALMLAYGLRRQRTGADLLCMVTDELSAEAWRALDVLFDRVVRVPAIFVPHRRRQERQDRPFWFTRWNALRLGRDGDLGSDYDKIVLLDADVLPLRHYDRLFQVPAPAGIPNEERPRLFDAAARDRARLREWSWHQAYRDVCPHGRPIPRQITDRVRDDPANMGINGSLFVVEPRHDELQAILEDVRRPEVARLVGDLFNWPDMQYITMHWSGSWHCIDARYSGMDGFPNLAALYGTHYAGVKPWYVRRNPRAVQRYSRYEDFRYWFAQYRAMLGDYPRLRRIAQVRGLQEEIERLTLPSDAAVQSAHASGPARWRSAPATGRAAPARG